jgi:hypothetical protein
MNHLMNIYEANEPDSGAMGYAKKNTQYFFLRMVYFAVFRFTNVHLLHKSCFTKSKP